MSADYFRARLDAIGPRWIYILVAVAAVGLIGAALFMQHVVGLNPCPLCILQRVAYLLLAVAAGLAAWRSPRPSGRRRNEYDTINRTVTTTPATK